MRLWRFLFVWLCMWIPVGGVFASTVLDPPDTSSPYTTMVSFERSAVELRDAFIKYQQTRSIRDLRATLNSAQRIRRLFDLVPLPPATRDETAREAVSLLMDILNRIPEFDRNAIPGAKGEERDRLPQRWTIPKTEIRIGRTESGPHAGEYQFTADTMLRLPEFHARIIHEPVTRPVVQENWSKIAAAITGPLIPPFVVEHIPGFAKTEMFDAPAWKFVASLLVFLLFGYVAVRIAGIISRRTEEAVPVIRLTGQLARPVIFFGMLFIWHLLNLTQIHFFGDSAIAEEMFSLVVLYVLLAWAVWVAVFLLIEVIIASPKIPDDSYDAHLLRLIARIVSPFAFGAILAYGATDIGIPALGVVAGLGVGGIAVALAAQSTIDNLFGGLSIFADRPFRIGDLIRYGDAAGVVQSIGLRSTRILSEDGNISVVPNGHLARISITNVTAHEKTGVTFLVRIKGDATPQEVTRCMESLKVCAASDPAATQRAPLVRLLGFETGAIEIEVGLELATSKLHEIEDIKNRLIIAFVAALQEAGVTPNLVRAAK
ncbi:MAG: mechanosensitive ion channel family protein [Beijerinckiaceae bacterium]